MAYLKTIIRRMLPDFLRYDSAASGPYRQMFNFPRIWKLAILLTLIVTLLPLILITAVDYKYSKEAIESENRLRTLRVASNLRHSISFFFHERLAALSFIVRDNSIEDLTDDQRLARILNNLQHSFSGFADLGLIGQDGYQISYVGPFNLAGRNYRDQPWFQDVVDHGFHISDVFLGFRNVPHLVIAVKHELPDGRFYILRTAFDTLRFNELLTNYDLSGRGEAFLINREGIIQSPGQYTFKIFEKVSFAVPPFSERTEIADVDLDQGRSLVCSAYIPDTPYILIVAKKNEELIRSWKATRIQLIGFLVVSIVIIVLVILGTSTYLVNNMYLLDQRRLAVLHEMEYSNKLASIGRLAAGIAHEINNPLAIINEKAGLIKDLFVYTKMYQNDRKIIDPVEAILSSVERCGRITHRLLGFARHMDSRIDEVNVVTIIDEVLGFLKKEAEFRNIAITLAIDEQIPSFQSDRGKLQQIFLNIINNAFAAMETDGKLAIAAKRENGFVMITITDNGCGMSQDEVSRIFEPFYSTKTRSGGTGLGLSITYGLVQELGGKVGVASELGKGTTFTVSLPLSPPTSARE